MKFLEQNPRHSSTNMNAVSSICGLTRRTDETLPSHLLGMLILISDFCHCTPTSFLLQTNSSKESFLCFSTFLHSTTVYIAIRSQEPRWAGEEKEKLNTKGSEIHFYLDKPPSLHIPTVIPKRVQVTHVIELNKYIIFLK